MTFLVQNRFKKNTGFKNSDGTDFVLTSSMTVYWVFQFYDNSEAKIAGTINILDNAASFNIPDNFFTEARIGALCHHYYIKDSDEVPKIQSAIVDDVLIKSKLTPAEIDDGDFGT